MGNMANTSSNIVDICRDILVTIKDMFLSFLGGDRL